MEWCGDVLNEETTSTTLHFKEAHQPFTCAGEGLEGRKDGWKNGWKEGRKEGMGGRKDGWME